MKDLYFIVKWDKIKQKTWSGTCWSLYCSLQEHFKLHEIRISNKKPNIIQRIINKIRKQSVDFGRHGILTARKTILKQLRKDTNPFPIFQFTDIVEDNIINGQTFVYQDLSVSYVSWMSKNSPEIFQYSGFSMIPQKQMEIRLIMENDYYQQCAGIFTMGQWLKNDFVQRIGINPNKVHHVGGGINLDKNLIKPKQKQNNKILFVGRDFKRKGGFLVYEAFCNLKEIQNDVELFIAGPSHNPILNPINGYHYIGDVSHNELSNLFNTCDIFVMPSYFEAYGLVFIEALTYGLPCIGRNVYEMPYFIEEGKSGLLIDSDNSQDLANKMHTLLHNQGIKDYVRNKRNWYIQEYSWDSVAKRIHNVIINSSN